MQNNATYVEDVSLPEIKKILSEKSKEKELNYEQKMAYEHAKLFAKLTVLKAEKLKKELLEIEDITDEVATKIIDILPNQIELELISEKNKCINDENKEQILALVKKYKKE
jgi:DNA-directed RNA polymerase subunit F